MTQLGRLLQAVQHILPWRFKKILHDFMFWTEVLRFFPFWDNGCPLCWVQGWDGKLHKGDYKSAKFHV